MNIAIFKAYYLALALSNGHNTLHRLFELTGMSIKRMHHIVINDIPNLGMEIEIEKMENGDTLYRLKDWGAVNPTWVRDKHSYLAAVLELPLINTIKHAE